MDIRRNTTKELSYSTPIPKINEYVREMVSKHNSGAKYPSCLNDVSQLFFHDVKEAKAFIKEWFAKDIDYTESGNNVLLSAKCLQRLFNMASMGLTPKQE